jgi:hypothetical protein
VTEQQRLHGGDGITSVRRDGRGVGVAQQSIEHLDSGLHVAA